MSYHRAMARLLSLVLLLAACGKDSNQSNEQAAPPPSAAATAPAAVTSPAAASIDVDAMKTPPPGRREPELNATQRTFGIMRQNMEALSACKPKDTSAMVNLHIAPDGKITYEVMAKQKVSDQFKGCVGKVLEKLSLPKEKVDLMFDI